MDVNSLECINPAKTMQEALKECSKRNTIVVHSDAHFKRTFESELFQDAHHYPLLVLVDRPSEINEYYKLLSSKDDTAVVMLDGVMNLDQVKEDWQEAVRGKKSRVIVTSCATALYIFVHGFVRMGEHFRTVYVPSMPTGTHSGHPFLKMIKLMYDPLVHQNVRIVGLGMTASQSALPRDEVVFALNEWNIKVRFYALELHCQVVNAIPTLPLPQLQVYPESNFSWSILQSDTLSIRDIRKRTLLLVEDGQLREALLDSLQRRQVTGDLQGVKVFSSDSPFFSNFAQEAACVLVCSFMHMQYLADVNIEEAMVIVKSSNQLGQLARALQRCAVPCQLCVLREDAMAVSVLGELKALLSVPTERIDKIVMQSGAVVHPSIASDLLMRFCSYLPKTSATGRGLKGLGVLTVPVRRLDSDGQIITTDVNDLFATQIVMPERLATWFPEPVVGEAMSSRADAQASASFSAFKRLVQLGLVDGNLLAIPDIRTQQESNDEVLASEVDELDSAQINDADVGEEVIPRALIYSATQAMHLYALEYQLEGPPIAQLPSWTRKLLLGGGDFFSSGEATWGVLLPERIATDLPPIQVALGAEHYLKVSLKSCDVRVDPGSKEFEGIVELQAMFFCLLNTRPLSVADELSDDVPELESLLGTCTYFLVPLKTDTQILESDKNVCAMYKKYLANEAPIQTNTSTTKLIWKIDRELIEELRDTESYKNCWEYIQSLDSVSLESDDKEGLLNFALSQLLLIAPYNGMYYRFRKMYLELHPDSPFQLKGAIEPTTYLGYVQDKYGNTSDIDVHQPLLGVGRVENFADISQWVLPSAEDEEQETSGTGPTVKKRKREDGQGKSALIPALVRIVPLGYWRVRGLMLVPKVMSELERQLQAMQYYNSLSIDSLPNTHLMVTSLAATTAGLPYNYERLEVLGDSLLKMAVSLELMSTEEVLGEGRLSMKRQNKISNNNLFRIGASMGIWRHAALTSFTPKQWTPPGILALLPVLDNKIVDERQILRDKLQKVMFDPQLRWKLLKTAEARISNREDPWTLTHEKTLLPPTTATSTNNKVHLSRCGMAIPNKFVADMVEASVGAFFLGTGMEDAWRYLIHIGILTPKILTGSSVPKVKQMGKLLGDPRDKLPLRASATVNKGKNVQKRKKVDWAKLPSASDKKIVELAEEKEEQQSQPQEQQVIIRASDMDAEYEKFVARTAIDYDKIEAILGYKFQERRLLLCAFTHISHSAYFCGERLEWLGDALLDWIVTVYYYQQAVPREMCPFELTEARKSTVNNVSLSEVTVYYRFQEFLLLGTNMGRLREEMELFAQGVHKKHAEYAVEDGRVFWELCQQEPLPPKALGDLLEALAGALFIDLQWDLTKFSDIFLRLLKPFMQRHRDPDALRTNPISMCLEGWNRLGVPRTDIIFEEVDASVGTMTVQVKVRKQVVGTGSASGRMLAKQLAAANAVQLLSTNPLLVQDILKK